MSRKTVARILTGMILAVLVISGTLEATKATELLYVENTNSGDVYVVDIPSHKFLRKIDVGVYLDDVTSSHKGDVLYVNRIQSAGVPGIPRVGESGEVVAISTATEEILWRVPVGGMPHHLTVSPDDRYLFVPLFDTFFTVVVDTQSQRVVNRIPVGYGPHGTKLSPDGKRLYVGTMFADQITVVDLATFQPQKAIYFDEAVRPFAITNDEKRAYVQLSRLHGFVVVDIPSGEITETVHLPKLPEGTQMPRRFPHTVNHGMALTPDNKLLFAAGSISGYVCIYSVPDHKLLATVPVGDEPNWIVFDSQVRYAYVSNRASDDLSVISVADMKEVVRIPMGKYPQRIHTVVLPESGN